MARKKSITYIQLSFNIVRTDFYIKHIHKLRMALSRNEDLLPVFLFLFFYDVPKSNEKLNLQLQIISQVGTEKEYTIMGWIKKI